MIALVEFAKDLVIEREDAEKLKIAYEYRSRFGLSCSYSGIAEPMNDNDYYKDELYFEEEKYYRDETKSKEVSIYNVYKRLPDKDWVYVNKSNNLVDLEHFALNCRFPYTITKCVKSEEPTVENLNGIVSRIEEKFSSIHKDLELVRNQQLNQKVNVHVGGGLIVTYNELLLKENCCTDELQECLTEGWRIIAVCVQPDQRRPDYVLGRFNPQFDCDISAKR